MCVRRLDLQRVLLQVLLDDLQVHLGAGGGSRSAPGPPISAQPDIGHVSHLTDREQDSSFQESHMLDCLFVRCRQTENTYDGQHLSRVSRSLRCCYYQTAHLLFFFRRTSRCSDAHYCAVVHHTVTHF